MENVTQKNPFQVAREIAVEPFVNNQILFNKIPGIVEKLFRKQFKMNLPDVRFTVPIVFVVGWNVFANYVQQQQTDEFALETCGVSLEYVTTKTESDKSHNIEPNLIHKKVPIFHETEGVASTGADFNGELLKMCNEWRTVNLQETLSSIENKIYTEVFQTYGIDLRHSCIVVPLLAAVYAAGIQVARENNLPEVNMYNMFKIKVIDDDKILLRPLNPLKHAIKDDNKR